MTDDENTPLVNRHTTPEERVRMVARQLSEPRTADWIATEADWSHEPTTSVLDRLAEDGILLRDESGSQTRYYPDHRHQLLQEAIRLRDGEATVSELTDRLAELKAESRELEEAFDVASPNQLRGTIATEDLETEEVRRRREVAREWEHLERRIRIVEFTIREWDVLAPRTDPTRFRD